MKNDDILRSWKEISAYLECDRRTCLRWEKSLGLPIRRMEGSEKGGVFAYKADLDRWLAQRTGHAGKQLQIETERLEDGRKWVRLEFRRWSRKRLIVFHLVVWALVIASFLVLQIRFSPRIPVDFRIDGSELVVLGGGGRELFRYDTKVKNLLETSAYRRTLQDAPEGAGGWHLPYIAFADIDLDGRREVLFTIQTLDEIGEGRIVCLDTRGRSRWEYKAGRELKFGDQAYSADYRIRGFDLNDLDGDGKREIQLFATHRPDWPCQFVNLSPDGKVRGEFWNSGYITDFIVADITGDDRPEIVLGGTNNEYGEGVAIVFDAADIYGASPQLDGRFRCEALSPGSEKFYIRLPRTDADACLWPIEAVSQSALTQSREFSFQMTGSGLFFEFDFSFALRRVRNSHQFIQFHKEAVEAGRIKSVLNEAYLSALGDRILYWDGASKAWTNRRAMANKW
jgi:hypothetical protein